MANDVMPCKSPWQRSHDVHGAARFTSKALGPSGRVIFSTMLLLLLSACGGGGSGESGTTAAATPAPPASTAPVTPPSSTTASEAFRGNLLLGAPTDRSIKLSVLSNDQSGSFHVSWGTSPGSSTRQSTVVALTAGEPATVTLDGLSAGTRYHYRLHYLAPGAGVATMTPEASFRTAARPGGAFSFTLQADSHLDENSDLDIYRRTLANVAADAADFHIDLGDTFMTEKHSQPLSSVLQTATSQAVVNVRYAYERGNFGTFSHSVPLFLVNGNHEGELGWLTNGTAQSLPVWATTARKRYFLNPTADNAFYSADTVSEPFVGERASWYAWTWGDALFIVLDPYWNSPAQASKDGWNLTLGERQYRWLASTLAASKASWKFVFLHNLVGGLDGQMRGGVEAAPFFEWGGRDADGTYAFDSRRPGWGLPVHTLLLQHKVTAVFHGHDHLYAKQSLDGIVYQLVPQPSARNSFSGPNLAVAYRYQTGTILSSSGHLRVTVGPGGVRSEYVRSWLPANETATRRNAQVDDTWTVGTPPASASPSGLKSGPGVARAALK